MRDGQIKKFLTMKMSGNTFKKFFVRTKENHARTVLYIMFLLNMVKN